jgi:hypothetical protein
MTYFGFPTEAPKLALRKTVEDLPAAPLFPPFRPLFHRFQHNFH